MFNILNDYITTKTAAAAARKSANAAIAIDGNHELPEACDKAAIHKAFTSLAKANKKAIAILDGLDGAAIFAEAEAKRKKARDDKREAEAAAFNAAIHAHLDAIMADDTRRALLIMEAQAAEELAAQAAQSGEVAATA